MGNHRFKLSDMMPRAWLHKLKGKKAHPTRTSSPSTPKRPSAAATEQTYQPRRPSYYFPSRKEKGPSSPLRHPRASDTLFPLTPPRKSKKKARRKQGSRPSNSLVSSVTADWSCRALGFVWETAEAMPTSRAAPHETPSRWKKGHRHLHHGIAPDGGLPSFDKLIIAEHYDDSNSVSRWRQPSPYEVTSFAADVAMDVGSSGSSLKSLRPILTKPTSKEAKSANLKAHRDAASKAKTTCNMGSSPPLKDKKGSLARLSAPVTRGLRMCTTSPRLESREAREQRNRKATAAAPASRRSCWLLESFALEKASSDLHRDFRDSMMEMIMENNIKGSSDLEDLLACYLSLNSNEYHDVIVKAFEQVWFDRRRGIHAQGR